MIWKSDNRSEEGLELRDILRYTQMHWAMSSMSSVMKNFWPERADLLISKSRTVVFLISIYRKYAFTMSSFLCIFLLVYPTVYRQTNWWPNRLMEDVTWRSWANHVLCSASVCDYTSLWTAAPVDGCCIPTSGCPPRGSSHLFNKRNVHS